MRIGRAFVGIRDNLDLGPRTIRIPQGFLATRAWAVSVSSKVGRYDTGHDQPAWQSPYQEYGASRIPPQEIAVLRRRRAKYP